MNLHRSGLALHHGLRRLHEAQQLAPTNVEDLGLESRLFYLLLCVCVGVCVCGWVDERLLIY